MSRSPRLDVRAPSTHVSLLLLCAVLGAVTAAAGAHHPSRHLEQIPLRLDPPTLPPAALAGQQLQVQLRPIYDGDSPLVFALDSGPDGMTIEAPTGVLTWTPPGSAEGSGATVGASVTDGRWTAHTSFTIAVAKPTPIATSVAGSTVTVTAPGTLRGFAVTLPAGSSLPPAQVKVSTVPPGEAAPIPDGVTRISDFFRVTPVDGGTDTITLTLPTSYLPAGRSAEALRLYVYTETAENIGADGALVAPFWIPTWSGFDELANGMVQIQLQGLGDLAFVGVDDAAAVAQLPVPASGSVLLRVGASTVEATCSPADFSNGHSARSIRSCILSGDVSLRVVIKGFERFTTTPTTTLDELLQWLGTERAAFSALGLLAEPRIEVSFERIPDLETPGFVTNDRLEGFRVLHLTDRRRAKGSAQGTTAHEYFHHAQSRTRLPATSNLMWTGRGAWIKEGTAMWFEDRVFDDLNTYRNEHQPLTQVLTLGLAQPGTEPEKSPYARFAFWKMVSSRCPGFSLAPILNCDGSTDPECLANFTAELESPAWQCDFDAGFGTANASSLASALLYYTYATVRENDIALLDANEVPHSFQFQQPGSWQLLQPSAECPDFDTCPISAMHAWDLAPAAAVAFVVAAVDPLPPGAGASLEVATSPARELWVWAGDDERPAGLADAPWSRTTTTWRHAYAAGGRAAKTMVVLVNPDPAAPVNYEIRAAITTPAVASASLDYESNDPFWNCTRWRGHFDAEVEATDGPELTVRLKQDASHANELVLDVYGGGSTAPAVKITGSYTFTPERNPSDKCPIVGGGYYVYTYSTPQRGAMTNFRTNTWWPDMGPFTLLEASGWHDDSLEVYWHVVRTRYTAGGALAETNDLGDFPYGYVGIYRRSGSPP